MKRSLLAAAIAVACAALPAAAQAGAGTINGNDYGAPKKFDAVVAGGVLPKAPVFPFNVTFATAAFSGPNGENPFGHMFFSDQGGPNHNKVFGKVECLRVTGNKATLIYTDKPGTTVGEFSDGGIVYFEDNGPPKNGQPKDVLGNARRRGAPPGAGPPVAGGS
jgi:hypothetical protein